MSRLASAVLKKDCENDRRNLQIQLKKLIGKKRGNEGFLHVNNDKILAHRFKGFFIRMTQNLNENFTRADKSYELHQPDFTLGELNCFRKVSTSEIMNIIGDTN